MAYDNNNTGMIAKNERMRPDKKDPEYTGFITVAGVEYWVKAWIRTGKDGSKMEGKKFFSLALDPKDAAPAARGGARPAAPARAPAPAPRGSGFDDMDDDIPF